MEHCPRTKRTVSHLMRVLNEFFLSLPGFYFQRNPSVWEHREEGALKDTATAIKSQMADIQTAVTSGAAAA